MSGIISGAIHLPAGEVRVAVHKADHPHVPDDTWFLHLDAEGGHVTLGGTLEELRLLADQVYELAYAA